MRFNLIVILKKIKIKIKSRNSKALDFLKNTFKNI